MLALVSVGRSSHLDRALAHRIRVMGGCVNGKMEEDVKPKDEDGVDGRGFCGWDGWVGGLGAVGDSSIFGLVRRTGAFTGGLLTFALVSGLHLAQHNRTVANATYAAQRFLHNLSRWLSSP